MSKVVYSKSKNSRISPRKARLVVNLIRGKSVVGLSEKLALMNNKGAGEVKRVFDSAIANATNNFDLTESDLIVKEARVDEGFTFKRGRPVSKGRYHRIEKKSSHIVIGVGTKE